MSDHPKKEVYPRCNACDFQKLKQMENNPAIRKLRDKIEQLNFRLTECRNENQMLKRNLQLAKKMVYQEVGGSDVDFQALLKYGTENGSKGRQEDVLVLKRRVQELKGYLKELEGDTPSPKETTSEEYVKYHMPSDKKKLWRMELERRLTRESAEKDINPLVRECFELRRTVDSEKTRFKELNEEVKLLRAELQTQVEKNEEDIGIANSFKTLESQLQETLAERAKIRNEIAGFRSRNKRLTEDISTLKNELQVLQKKTNDSDSLIESMTNSHKSIQEAIEAEKVIVQQNIDRYKNELNILQENHETDVEILDHLQCIIHDRNDLLDQLKKDVTDGLVSEDNGKKNGVASKSKGIPKVSSKESKTMPNTTLKSKEEVNVPVENVSEKDSKSESELTIRKLRLELAKYKSLCEAARLEGKHLNEIILKQDSKMSEIAIQVAEAGRLTMQKNVEKKNLIEKVNKLQKSLSAKRRKGKIHIQPKNRLEELRIKTDAQREENDFLRNFLRSAVCNKAKDLQLFKSTIAETKEFFLESLKEIKEQYEADPVDPESNQLSEPVNEQDDQIV